jgi:hypothetical protein
VKELRWLWLVGVVLAVAFLFALQSLLGFSWDAWSIGFILIAVVWILFQWYRRYPGG